MVTGLWMSRRHQAAERDRARSSVTPFAQRPDDMHTFWIVPSGRGGEVASHQMRP